MGNDHVSERHGFASPGTAFRAAIARVGASAAAVVATAAMMLCTIPANAVETQVTDDSETQIQAQATQAQQPAKAAVAPDANLGVALGPGATGYTVESLHQQGAKDESLAAVIKWRQDALNDTSVKWPSNTNGKTMRQYLADHNISESDYLSPKWSNALERIAIQRAVEAGDADDGHKRMNGEGNPWGATYNGYGSSSEILAWGSSSFANAMDQWAEEKADWVGNTGGVTGHYTTLINPSYMAYGFGAASSIEYRSTYAGEATSSTGWDETPTNLQGDYTVEANLSAEKLAQGVTSNVPNVLTLGTSFIPTVKSDIQNKRFTMRGTWATSDASIAAIQPDGSVLGKAAGTAILTFTLTDGAKETFTVEVSGKSIKSVTSPHVTVDSGTDAPTDKLPKTVDVTYTDGSTGTAQVVWDAIPDNWSYALTQHDITIHGTVEGFAAGVDLTLTVRQAVAQSVDVLSASGGWDTPTVQTAVGTSPDVSDLMPGVSWSNGYIYKNPSIKIAWNQSDLDASRFSTPGDKVTIHGTVKVPYPDDSTQFWTFDTSIDVTVIVKQVSTVEGPSGIYTTVESGTKPDLSGAKATVTYADGTTSQADVDWNEPKEADYTNRNGGDFKVSGTVTVKTAGGSGNASMTTTVQLTYRVNPATITSANTGVDTITTQAGVDPTPQLPKTARVAWSNGDLEDLSITWNAIDRDDYAHAGTFQASGTVSWNGITHPVTQNITVAAPPAATVTGVKPTKTAVTTIAGHAPALDQVKATVTYSDGSTQQNVDVDWDEVPADKYAAAGEFDVNGVVTVDGKDWPVSVHVTVESRRIVKVTPSEDAITVDPVKDTDPVPAVTGEATVTWSDGTTESRSIALNLPAGWNHPRTAHTVTATGHVSGWDTAVEFPVQVNAATIESVVHVLPSMTTTVGVQPVLPQTTKATWSNGETSDEPILWNADEVPPDVSKPGIVTVEGSVAIERRFGVWFTLTVKAAEPSEVPVTGVVVSGPSTLTVGETGVLTATVTPENATNKTVTWRSSNTSVVTIDPNLGTVSARSEGKSIITATALDGSGVIGAWEITVNAKVVPDTTAPTFSGVGDVTIDFGASFDSLKGVTATDDRDGDLTAAIKVSGSVDTSRAGEYTLTYTVSDKAGNKATVVRKITVRAQEGPAPECTVSFSDVTETTSHADDIKWLACKKIAAGYPNGDGTVSFGGMRTVVRQDMAAFLYRLAGSPGYTPSAQDRARFTDVNEWTPHAKEIWWLAATGITKGYPNGDGTYSFGGMRTVVRQDMAAFLKRYADWAHANPTLGAERSFTDVNPSTAHAEEIWWLARTGVASGYPDGSFGGMRDVVRQDMAAFLHRMSTNVLAK